VNARDAMPLGGRLTLRTRNVGAEDSQRHKGGPFGEYVLVRGEDTGKGTGRGLSAVYGIVKQTGGFIYVESELGKGTIFRIFLPRHIPVADDVRLSHLPEARAPR